VEGFTKAGARHSKEDLERVQGIHDLVKDLGATCTKAAKPAADPDADPDAPPADKAATATATKVADAPAPVADPPVVTKAAEAALAAPAVDAPAAAAPSAAAAPAAEPVKKTLEEQIADLTELTSGIAALVLKQDGRLTNMEGAPAIKGVKLRVVDKGQDSAPATGGGQETVTKTASDGGAEPALKDIIKKVHAAGGTPLIMRGK